MTISPKRPAAQDLTLKSREVNSGVISNQAVQGGAEMCTGCGRIMLHMKQKSTGSCMMICPVSAKRPYIESLGYEEEK